MHPAGLYPHHNPATGKVQAQVLMAGAADVDKAVASARAALPGWRAMPVNRRGAILNKLADLLEEHSEHSGIVSALENGNPVAGLGPGAYTALWTRYYAGWCDKIEGSVVPTFPVQGLDYILQEPWGVVGVMVPWNGPMMGMGQKAVPALAAGNTVVAKPPEVAPFGAYLFAELALEAGVPPGVLNVVAGGPEAGEALVRHPGIDKVSFTGGGVGRPPRHGTRRGNTQTGGTGTRRQVRQHPFRRRGSGHRRTDGRRAQRACCCRVRAVRCRPGFTFRTRSTTRSSPGWCRSRRPSASATRSTRKTQMGPVITEAAVERILGMIERATEQRRQAADRRARLGGALADGYFLAPTILGDVDQASEIARNEVFGPVLSVLRFSDEADVVAKANDSSYGLAAYIHTRDIGRAHRVAHAIDAGSISINGMSGMSPTAPFGGYKQSGFGREGGRAGIEEWLRPRTSLFRRADVGSAAHARTQPPKPGHEIVIPPVPQRDPLHSAGIEHRARGRSRSPTRETARKERHHGGWRPESRVTARYAFGAVQRLAQVRVGGCFTHRGTGVPAMLRGRPGTPRPCSRTGVEARNATTSATSSGCPMRGTGISGKDRGAVDDSNSSPFTIRCRWFRGARS